MKSTTYCPLTTPRSAMTQIWRLLWHFYRSNSEFYKKYKCQ